MTGIETQPWDPLSAGRAARPWLWAGLAVLVCGLQGIDFVHSLRPPRTRGVDLFQDWASARNLLTGLPVYSSHRETIERYLGYRAAEVNIDIDVNAHPPSSILLVLIPTPFLPGTWRRWPPSASPSGFSPGSCDSGLGDGRYSR